MGTIPRDRAVDSTLAMMADPYRFIQRKCRQFEHDLFQTRILLRQTVCMTGRDAAQLFYNNELIQRQGAAPLRLQKTLFGRGGVQTLDDAAHRQRKSLFLSITQAGRVRELATIAQKWCEAYATKWQPRGQVVLYDEFRQIFCRSICDWAGVELPEADVASRTNQLTALFDRAGSVGPSHWLGRLARWRADRWIEDYIEAIRAGRTAPPEDSAAHVIAWHRQLDERLLPARVAAVELLNVLRPTVAVAVYIVFVALALHEQSNCREELASGKAGFADAFIEEVRRFYPFFPALIAKTRREFDWNGYHFSRGMTVLLDVYGTNHDERLWENPDAFRAERFLVHEPDPFGFIPQGGGDAEAGHRCPGEPIALALMKMATQFLCTSITYGVPPQDLTVDLTQLPALPSSRFVINDVRVTGG